jgi:hypothetical protein
MSATQTNCVYPHLARSWLRSQLSLRGRPTDSKAPCGVTRGPDVSRRPCPLRRIVIERELSSFVPHGLPTRAWAFSSHGVDATEPLTPLSRSPVHPHASFPFRRRCNLAGRPSFGRFRTGRRMRRPPRPPVAPARESWRLMNDLGCLPSVGALRRIRWPLQPQSRDLRTAFGDEEALDGDLSPPWVFCRTSPVLPVRPTRDARFARGACRRYHPPTFDPS